MTEEMEDLKIGINSLLVKAKVTDEEILEVLRELIEWHTPIK